MLIFIKELIDSLHLLNKNQINRDFLFFVAFLETLNFRAELYLVHVHKATPAEHPIENLTWINSNDS